MDFETFKKEKYHDILNQFMDPDVINLFRKEYGIPVCDFENDVCSYEDLYKNVGYAFLFFGRAIAKTMCEISTHENGSTPIMKRYTADNRDSLIDRAWYWVYDLLLDGFETPQPIPMMYSAKEKNFKDPSLVTCFEDDIPKSVVIFGPIPLPEMANLRE
jgi:hypothetical protein